MRGIPRLKERFFPSRATRTNERRIRQIAGKLIEKPRTVSEKRMMIDALVKPFCDKRAYSFFRLTILRTRTNSDIPLGEFARGIMGHFDLVIQKNSNRLSTLEADLVHAREELTNAHDEIRHLTNSIYALSHYPEAVVLIRHSANNEFGLLIGLLGLMRGRIRKARAIRKSSG